MSEDLLSEIGRRKALADAYYDNYRRRRELKDFAKASEFLWGVVSNLTYCLGLLYGRKLGKHREVVAFLKELAGALRDDEMLKQIRAAEALHANFYHDFMSEDEFESYRWEVELLAIKLARVLKERVRELKERST